MLGAHNVDRKEGAISGLLEGDAADEGWLDRASSDHLLSTTRSVELKRDFKTVGESERYRHPGVRAFNK